MPPSLALRALHRCLQRGVLSIIYISFFFFFGIGGSVSTLDVLSLQLHHFFALFFLCNNLLVEEKKRAETFFFL